jgi:hypothetical protein
MRRLSLYLAIAMLSLGSAMGFAQTGYTTVTASIPQWTNATVLGTFVNQSGSTGTPTVGGNVILTTYSGRLDGAGNLSATVADNLVVSTKPSCWIFQIQKNGYTFTTACLSVTGTTYSITTAFANAPDPNPSGGGGANLPESNCIIKGDGTGNGACATVGTDYPSVASVASAASAASAAQTTANGAAAKANNGSDFANLATVRTNLSIPTIIATACMLKGDGIGNSVCSTVTDLQTLQNSDTTHNSYQGFNTGSLGDAAQIPCNTLGQYAFGTLAGVIQVCLNGAGWIPFVNGGSNSPNPFVPLTDGAPVTWGISSVANASATLTMVHTTTTRAINVSGQVNNGNYLLVLKQDSTGGAQATLGTGCTWVVHSSTGGYTSGTALPLVTTALAINILTFTYDGTTCYVNVG